MATQKPEARNGVVPGVAHLALDVVDRSQSLAIAVLHDARAEIRAVVDGTIELVEKTSAAGFRFTRKLVQRIDESVSETLSSTERLVNGALRSARDTTKAATDLAHTAAQGIAGDRVAAVVA